MTLAFRRFQESGPVGALNEGRGWDGAQVRSLVRLVVRLVRVDVAVGELHVATRDVEAAALPEERRSLSEGSRKVLPWGDGRKFRELAGARV